MNGFAEQIEPLTGALSIDPPDRYRWFGKWSDRPSAAARERIDRDTRRFYLVARIQVQLYRHFYLRGGATPERLVIDYAPAAHETSFVRSLSEANHGKGCWQGEWTVIRADDEGLWAERDGLTVWIASDAYRREPEAEQSAVSSIFVHLPKEFTAQQPGYYLAQSDEPFDPAPGGVLVRLYWHVSPAGGLALMRSVTSRLNGERIPFRLKVLNDPGAYQRNDAAVLYITKQHLARASLLLQRVRDDVRPELQPGEPVLTKRLAPGVGLAEDPGTGESFGLHRCRLLAEAFVEATERGSRGPDEMMHAIEDRFRLDGVDLARPYLNRGSVDDYDALLDLPRWSMAVASQAPHDSGIVDEVSLDESAVRPNRYRETAQEIGDRLVQDACWHDGRCTWLGTPATPFARYDPTREPAFGSVGADIYAGTAGIALFLAELYAETGGEQYRTTSRGAIAQALAMIDTLDPAGAGLYTGWPGIVVAAARIGRLIGDEDLVRAVPIRFIERIAGVKHGPQPDLLSGTAGTLVASLILWREAEDERLLAHAIQLGDLLSATAKQRGDALCWPVMTHSGRRALTGFAHGAAGIAFALLELFAATHQERFRVAAEGAFAFERRNFSPAMQNWLDLRYPVVGSRFGPAAQTSSVWCHGSGGIAISRLAAWKILRDPVYLDEARIALQATSTWVESLLPVSDRPWSLCHGLCGNADILLWASDILPERSVELQRLSERVADVGLASGEPHLPFDLDEPGLMLGLAGIGHFYLRLASHNIPSLLVPSAAEVARLSVS